VVFDAKAAHRIQLDDPDAVTKSIREVQAATAKHRRLSQ